VYVCVDFTRGKSAHTHTHAHGNVHVYASSLSLIHDLNSLPSHSPRYVYLDIFFGCFVATLLD